MNSPQLVFKYLPTVQDLPLILAGPILRRTTSNSVTVWLALKSARSLCLEIYATQADGTKIGQTVMTGKGKTIALGKHLHILTITAKAAAEKLKPDHIYAYNIYCQSSGYSLIEDTQDHRYSLSYFNHQLPTFVLPPTDLNHLKIVHGSCRKPHGGGKDTLAFVDNLISQSPQLPSVRPHQLFMTGDQIYGDDVADPILWLIQGISTLLLGWTEELPLISGTITTKELLPGKRTKIAEIEAGLTAMFRGASDKAKSHLMSFGEYVAAYLLAWSPVLIPAIFPSGQSLFKDRKQARRWQQEVKDIRSFVKDLHFVRRGLANIPVYTICDDHDVSDDWYLNREWCDRVLGKPLGKRIVQNGILTYALFQAWGNTPQHFAPGTAGDKLIQLVVKWCQSKGKDELIKTECDRYLGIPKNDPLTQMPELAPDGDVAVLKRDQAAIPWHYTVAGHQHQVIVLDTRTWRGYNPQPDQGLEPPMLLSPQAFEQQLAAPLSRNQLEATIIVLPTNLVALGIIDRIQKFELNRGRVFSNDVGDSWNFNDSAFAQLLLTLCNQRQRVIILSGDIHYSCAVKLSHWDLDTQESSVLVQLTSSAIKNSELATRLAHTKLKSLFPEKNKRWRVQNRPFKLKQTTKQATADRQHSSDFAPDWQYHVEWCKRQPAQSLSWQRLAPITVNTSRGDRKAIQPQDLWRKLITSLSNWFWRNRWLQEGTEVVGRNNLSLVRFEWQHHKAVIQETYWHPPWDSHDTVKSLYTVSLEADSQDNRAVNSKIDN